MAWIRVDERFFRCPEAVTAGPVAALLYLDLTAYALRFNLNGAVPRHAAEHVARPKRSHLQRLVDVGLLLDTGESYVIVERWIEDDVMIDLEPVPAWLRQRIFERDGYRCLTCGATANLSIDHIVSRFRGGESTHRNLQTLCRPCNSQKGAR